MPPKVDADAYGSSFMAWWIAIQPSWRLTRNTTFVYDLPSDEEWHVLHKGGSAGLYVVVVALLWWIRVLPAEPLSFHAWSAMRDVQWVIDQICKKLLSNSKRTKQGHDGTTPLSKAKRYVVALVTYLLSNHVTAGVVQVDLCAFLAVLLVDIVP